MIANFLTVSAVMLLLALYNVNATPVQCGDMTPADCKKLFTTGVDKMISVKVKDLQKARITKTIEMYTAALEDMPADSATSKLVAESLDEMKKAVPIIDKLDSLESDEITKLILNIFSTLKPNFEKAAKEDTANIEKFQEILLKKGFPVRMLEDRMTIMMNEIGDMWTETYSGLREEDLKTYPQYKEMNEMMTKMIKITDLDEKAKVLEQVFKKMLELNETPFIKSLGDNICLDC